MSYFIDLTPRNQKTTKDNQYKIPKSLSRLEYLQNSQKRTKISFQTLAESLKYLQAELISLKQVSSGSTINIRLHNVHRQLSSLAKIRLDFSTGICIFTFNLLTDDSRYMKIPSKQKRHIFYKAVCSMPLQTPVKQFKLSVSQTNHILKLQKHLSLQPNINTKSYLQLVYRTLQTFKKQIIKFADTLFDVIGLTNQQPLYFQSDSYRLKTMAKQERMGEYNSLVNVQLHMLDGALAQNYIVKKIQEQSQSIQNMRKNVVVDKKNKYCFQLYQDSQNLRKVNKKLQLYQIDQDLKQWMVIRREKDYAMTTLKGKQGVLNYIKLQHPLHNNMLIPFSSGGFTNIFLTRISFVLIGSWGQQQIQDQPQIQTRQLLLKRQSRKGPRQRNKHQIQILKRIKNGKSIYLPHYFILHQQCDIFMDFVRFPTLNTFCKMAQHTNSFKTKIYLGLQITMALKHLQKYQIVHLDIKPTNIMLYHQMSVKLIDFGESYHPFIHQISNNNYRPGFSHPYSAPQNYTYSPNMAITSKNDVFSLGFILYELFLDKRPFLFSDQKMDQVYNQGSLGQHWFFCFEQTLNYGQRIALPFVMSLIGKCLHIDPSKRPQLSWIQIVLRECLEYLY